MRPARIATLIREYAESIFIDHYSGDQRRAEFQVLLQEHLRVLAAYIEDEARNEE